MAAGKPVVTTDINGYRDVVHHEQEGLLVEPKDPDGLSRAILRVINDRDLARRLGNAGREHAHDYSWATVTRRVVECYADARRQNKELGFKPTAASSLFGSTRRP
jgi:glycosyltransferase involved in cell wall biosynthesis